MPLTPGRCWPGTLRSLIVTGFLFALAPPLAALAWAAWTLNTLVAEVDAGLETAVAAAREGRGLVADLTELQRAARQFIVLQTPEQLHTYHERRVRAGETLDRLRVLVLDAERERLVDQIAASLPTGDGPPIGEDEVLAARFAPLDEQARAVLALSDDAVEGESRRLREVADAANRRLATLAALGLLAGTGCALLAGGLIASPTRQLARAIRRLGDEDFETPVALAGPSDMQALAARLDWLRTRLAGIEAQKHRFLRHVSHELKTPLTALREGSELLRDGTLGPLGEDQREVAGILTDNARRLSTLIEDLLNFNRLLARSQQLEVAPVGLGELVEAVAGAHRLAGQARNVGIVLDLPDDLVVQADREKLRTILDNLLSNALKFARPSGRVALRAGRYPGGVAIEVEDDGPGIPPGERERVFELFYQGSHQPDAVVRGSGLGLALAREFARLHGGELIVADGRGSGACLCLTLPASAGSTGSASASPAVKIPS